MKYLLLILTFSIPVLAGQKTYHKTADGKYPFYFEEVAGQGNQWNDEVQSEYDDKMDETINELCIDTVSVKRAQATLDHEKEVGNSTGFVDMTAMHDAGSVIANMRPIIAKLAKIVKDGTGKEASTYSCP